MMTNKRVTFGESVEYYDVVSGQRKWRKAHIEYDIEDSADFHDELTNASSIVGSWFGKEDKSKSAIGVINKEKERVEIAIDNCESLQQLKTLENDAIKYAVVEQYLAKKKSFQ